MRRGICRSGTASAVHLVKLKPGGMAPVKGPSIGTKYQAVAFQITIASETFHYQIENGGTARI